MNCGSRRLLSTLLFLGILAVTADHGEAQTAAPAAGPVTIPGASPLGRFVARRPGRKNVLAWIDSRSAVQSHAAAVIERLGYDSGVYDTYIRTDALAALGLGASPQDSGLEDFDAVFFLGSRDADLAAPQRAALLTFVKNGGGFVAGHAATGAFTKWDEFADMIGGRLVQHPWGKPDKTTLIIEEPSFPGLQGLPQRLATHDETYELGGQSRDTIDVLIRLDPTGLDASKPYRKDGDFPMVWIRNYGKGRVYSNTLGHEITAWDSPAYRKMYLEAMKWALGLTDRPVQPHALVKVDGTPKPLK
jgi:type 1 glutamine amidotransferase